MTAVSIRLVGLLDVDIVGAAAAVTLAMADVPITIARVIGTEPRQGLRIAIRPPRRPGGRPPDLMGSDL